MRKLSHIRIVVAFGLVLLFGYGEATDCVMGQSGTATLVDRDVRKDDRFLGVAWVQNSAEYRQLTRQTYRLALMQLKEGLKHSTWSADEVQDASGGFEMKPTAIILDVDETILDNSAFNARNIIDGKPYTTASWNAWCSEEKALLIPGALEFVRAASALGVKIYFVTNRRDEVKQATINNLNALGFHASPKNVLTKNADAGRSGNKISRRAMVAKDFRIVMMVGDSMSDLCSGMDTRMQNARNETAAKTAKFLGSRWIVLPNPVYGGWERALRKNEGALRIDR